MSEARFLDHQRDDDALTYTIDYANWLGSDTIASVTRETDGTDVVSGSNTTTTTTQLLSGPGHVDIMITTAANSVKTLRISIERRSEDDGL